MRYRRFPLSQTPVASTKTSFRTLDRASAVAIC